MKPRPDSLHTETVCKQTGCGKMYVTVSKPESEYKEVFGILGKTGGCAACNVSSLTRTITIAWNYGAPIEKLIKQLNGAMCPHSTMVGTSCPQAIADVLRETQVEKEERDG